MTIVRRVGDRREAVLLALLLSALLAIRLYHLGSFPGTFLGDEADNSQDALRILHGDPPPDGFFGVDWTPQPAMSIYVQAGFFKLFGASVLIARLPSALFTTLALAGLYLLLRRTVSMTSALVATLLLGTNLWFLNFSRSAWNNAWVCVFLLGAMLALLRALDSLASGTVESRRTWGWFAAAGAFCAAGIYGYPSGRTIVVGALLFLPVALRSCRRAWKDVLLGYLVLVIVTVALVTPLAVHAARNWSSFNRRTTNVSLTATPQFKSDPAEAIWGQLTRNVRAPWDGAVNNTPRYTPSGQPQIDRLSGILIAVGMALSLLLPPMRRLESWLTWLMLLAAWGLTQIPTSPTPDGARGVIYVPLLVYFTGIAVEGASRSFAWLSARRGKRALRPAAAAVVLAGAAVIGAVDVDHYVSWQRSPQTRTVRAPYLDDGEFRAWSAQVLAYADARDRTFPVDQWRAAHPLSPTG